MGSHTEGCSLTNLLVKYYYNDLLDRQSSGRGKDEVTYFYVGDIFVNRYLGTKYADFQEKKSSQRFMGKSSKFFIVVTLLLELFPRNIREHFFLKIRKYT